MQDDALESTMDASSNRTHVLSSMGRSSAVSELQLHLLQQTGVMGRVESGVSRCYRELACVFLFNW